MTISNVSGPSQPLPPPPPHEIKPLILKFQTLMEQARDYSNPQYIAELLQTIKALSALPNEGSSELLRNLHAMLRAPLFNDVSLLTASQDTLPEILKMHVKLPASAELFNHELNTLIQDL